MFVRSSTFKSRPIAIGAVALWSAVFGLVSNATAQSAMDFSVKPSADDKQGNTAFVAVSQAFVYSGPSEDFYPTDQLKQGVAVQVFHRTESGWAAIRPPTGSFSWLPASEAFLLPGGRTAEVTSNNSVSWIGTSLGTAKQFRWQIRLNHGEQLVVLGEETVMDSDGNERLWYKIAPPNGEFRWIQSDALSSEPPVSLIAPKSTARSPEQSKADKIEQGGATTKEASHATEKSTDDGVKPASYAGQIIDESEGIVVGGEYIQGEFIEGEPIDGEYYDGEIYEGEIIDGEVVEGQITDGDVLYDEGEPAPDASWNDWQLFEFTDEGLRFPLWEKNLARRAAQRDPLLEDPFSLEMAPKIKGSRVGLITEEDLRPAPAPRRRTPWRDPRELSQLRMQGFPQASGLRGQGTTLSTIRDAFNSSTAAGGGLGLGPAFAPVAPSTYYDPRHATPSLGNPTLTGPNPAPSLDMATSLAPAATGTAPGGSWMSRNWFGVSNQSGTVAGSMVETTSTMLMQLQSRLNEMVTQPMMQWNFGTLKEQVKGLIQNGGSPVERGQARLLMERIQEFELLAMRSGYILASGTDQPMHQVVTASYVQPPQLPPGGASADALASFDATGWLVPVHAAIPGQPTHAITDDSGKIVAYVTGLPGTNLDRYINQAIGIRGLRGFLPQFQAAHIEAQTVVRLK